MNSKAEIRRHYLAARRKVPLALQRHASEAICQRILSMKIYQKALHIGLYYAIRGEIDLRGIFEHTVAGRKKIYLPKIKEGDSLDFIHVHTYDHLLPNRFGIPEPMDDLSIGISMLDILFVPLVAFDRFGTRLGHGKGYYDRALRNERPKKIIGIGYTFQNYPGQLPCDPWDIPLDAVITETAIEWFNSTHPPRSPLF